MKLNQRERDDLADCVRRIAEITEPYLSDFEITDFLRPYIGDEEYSYLWGEIGSDHDLGDMFR